MLRFLRRLPDLILVLCLIAVLACLAIPSDSFNPRRTREAVLKINLNALRQGIDQFHKDHHRYPTRLDELVSGRYLVHVPIDPMTDSSQTWLPIHDESSEGAVIVDVRSGAKGSSLDGELYSSW